VHHNVDSTSRTRVVTNCQLRWVHPTFASNHQSRMVVLMLLLVLPPLLLLLQAPMA
jgi:hypothetical protein